MKIFFKKLKIRFFWLTLERFPSLFRPSSKPFVSGDTFRKFSDHIFDETKSFNPKSVKSKDVIFVNADLLEIYFEMYFQILKLVSTNHHCFSTFLKIIFELYVCDHF